MKRYANYKQTGIAWLPQVPEHWNLMRGKRLFRVVDDRSQDGSEELLTVSHITGVTPRSQKNVTMFQAESLVGYKRCQINDLAANTMWMWQGAIGVSKYAGVISPAYDVYRQRKDFYNPRFLDLLLRTPKLIGQYHALSTGIQASRLRLYPNVFLTISFPLPPREEQDQIVRFLDWKVARINKLIANYRHELTIFDEIIQKLIDDVVTKGMHNKVQLIHNNDIRWNIDYPEHWRIQRIRESFSFRKGLSITKENLEETGIAVINYGQIHSKKNSCIGLNEELIKHVNESYLTKNPSCLVEKGDFIFADTSEDISGCGNCAFIDRDNTIFAGYHSIIAHPKNSENSKYLAYLFKTSAWRYQLHKKVNGVKVYSITQKMLKDTFILIPPVNEQEEIIQYLDKICAKINTSVKTIEEKIVQLQELKTRLISDVVTGKIDVRGIEIPEYESVEEALDEIAEDADEAEITAVEEE